MRILGIDPGTGRLGWGIVDVKKGNYSFVACGCIEIKPGTDLAIRLETIFDTLQTLITKHQPDEMAVESLFFATNAKTAIDVASARGVVLLAGKKSHLPISQYTPLHIKSTLTGYGQADKKQIQFMVVRLLQLKETPQPDDAADAIAVALTHAFQVKTLVSKQ